MSRRRLLVPAAAVFFLATALFAQVTERIDVSAIEVPVVVHDAKGNVPLDLKPSDFLLKEDGKTQEIVGVAYPVRGVTASASGAPSTSAAPATVPPEKRWQVVVYLQQSLSSSHALKVSLERLVPHVDEMIALGDVEVVGDEGARPHVLIPATRDAGALRDALLALAPKIRGTQDVVRLRQQYIEESVGTAGMPKSALDQRALMTARLDAMMIAARQDSMLAWFGRYGVPTRPRAAIIVSSGYDTEFSSFYTANSADVAATIRQLSVVMRQQEMGEAMAAQGWTVLSFAPEWMETQMNATFDVGNSGRGRLGEFVRGGNPGDTGPTAVNLHPLDPLRQMADATGGTVEVNPAKFGVGLSDLSDRVVLTYQLHGPHDGRMHRITVKALRPGLTVRAQRSVVSGTPEAVSIARATMLAGDEGEKGELPVRCSYRDTPTKSSSEATAQLEVMVSLAPINVVRSGLTAATLRFSLAVTGTDAPPVTSVKRMDNVDLSKQAKWLITFEVRHRAGARIGVVAEEVSTGAWGGCTCTAGALTPMASAAEEPVPPAAQQWQPVEDALKVARATNRLVLLDYRRATVVDKRGDEWIAAATAHEAVARAFKEMVLAVASLTPPPSANSKMEAARSPGEGRHLLVLDPYGNILVEPESAFKNIPQFAAELNAIRLHAEAFVHAGDLQANGKMADAIIERAGTLLDSGFESNAGEVFRKGYDAAKEAGDVALMQVASTGVAAVDISKGVDVNGAVRSLEAVVAHPATPEVGARAWMLLGHTYRNQRRDVKKAIDAYQRAFAGTTKPSPLADAARRHLEMLGSEPYSETQTAVATGNVHLLYPHREVLVGKIDVGVATSSDAARVEIYLDDARVAELRRRPFRARVPLGPTPNVHTIRAVAFDGHESRLGEESVTINDSARSLGVAIVAPRLDKIESSAVVEVEPRLPEGVRLAGVDLYWNETKVATMTAAPFRKEVTLPAKFAAGYLRAVARGENGATAEDVKMINTAGAADAVSVDAVQVYAVVQDRRGRNVEGLGSKDFVVKEDGVPVAVELQSTASDPVSVGLALDVSGSMRETMGEVIDYANEFVATSMREGDQTFVVGFADQPHLIQPLTADRQRVAASIDAVHAGGSTAIWDAVLFSLQQLQSVSGKRALVVFTDGINNGGTATPNSALQYAREVGVPVYVVLMFSGWTYTRLSMAHAGMTSPQLAGTPHNLKWVAESTGGAFFEFVRRKDLPRVFGQVLNDTRGEYLLTYTSPNTKPRNEMRRVSVAVPNRGVVVRAMSGYYPR
jgi:Ca-activated chloride channel family protein